MPSPDEAAPAPLFLELAPPPGGPTPVDHMFVFRDWGHLTGHGSGRFATDLFTLSFAFDPLLGKNALPRPTLTPPRPAFSPRIAPFRGVSAGLRLASAPERLPPEASLVELAGFLHDFTTGNEALVPLVAALDGLACELGFPAIGTAPTSARSERRSIRMATGMSRRRLAATRRFRHLLGGLAKHAKPLGELALDTGYYDQSHMSAACRAFAGKPPGAIRLQAAAPSDGRFFQDNRLNSRLRLIIDR